MASSSSTPSFGRENVSCDRLLSLGTRDLFAFGGGGGGGEGSLLDDVSASVSRALGREVRLEATDGEGGGLSGGGGGAAVSTVTDPDTGTRYFVKSAPISSGGGRMLRAEYLGVKEMAAAAAETGADDAIKVPDPVAYGEGGPNNEAFVVFEYLRFTGGGSGRELGRRLAILHRRTSPNGRYGFHVNNTIGATPQPNTPWRNDWADFWDEHRLAHMLRLSGNAGFDDAKTAKLRRKTRELLGGDHDPPASLIHGDLWGGNKGFVELDDGDVVPVIFDPATYYGDREADVAMTHLFGGFGSDFYEGYESEWPLPEGHETRRTVYNLYHVLNHYVLFGGSYLQRARGMIESILRC